MVNTLHYKVKEEDNKTFKGLIDKLSRLRQQLNMHELRAINMSNRHLQDLVDACLQALGLANETIEKALKQQISDKK